MYSRHYKLGSQCLVDTFYPINYLEAPLLILYAPVNLMMLLSGILVGVARSTRHVCGWLFLACFTVTLTVPWCAADLKVRYGCVLWSLSFLQLGIGCLLLPAEGLRRKVARARSYRGAQTVA
ncbi:MAG: hypothetical protein FJ271_08090 [Planctomycetes bacterium]|nr:hypothetical protein [Planctomycetota bacterium]